MSTYDKPLGCPGCSTEQRDPGRRGHLYATAFGPGPTAPLGRRARVRGRLPIALSARGQRAAA
jgi:hypothetical protein